jgi:hypothetical protein
MLPSVLLGLTVTLNRRISGCVRARGRPLTLTSPFPACVSVRLIYFCCCGPESCRPRTLQWATAVAVERLITGVWNAHKDALTCLLLAEALNTVNWRSHDDEWQFLC